MEHNNKVSEKVEYFSRLAMKESLNSVNKTIIHPIQQHKLKCQNEQTVSLEEKFKNKENINFNLKLINDQQITCNLKKLYPEMLTRRKSKIILKLTENLFISEMINNEEEIKMIGYLQNRFNNFVVYKFNQQLKTCFKKVQCFGEPEMSLEFVIMVCKSVKGWLEFDKNCVFIFEKSGNQTNFLFLVLCIMKLLNFAENPLNILSQKYQIKMIEGLLKRRLNEFTCILEKGCETKKQLLFYQIIFSTKTGKLDSFSEKDFILKIFCENKVYEFNSKEEPHFKDEFYLIFFLKELPVKGEVKLILFSENKEIFVLNFNAFFYESGIFRLEEEEIDFITQKKNSQIWLDIAFKENKMISLKVPYSLDCTLFESLQIICDHFNKSVNLKSLNELSKQFNKNFAKFVLLQEISLVDLPKYIETLPSKIEKKIRFASMNFAQNKGNETLLLDTKIEKAKKALEILTVASVQEKNEEENYKINNFEPEENYQNETLEILTETNFEEVTTLIKTNVKRAPPSFKKKQEDLPTVFARKPLHLTGMMSRDSIFNDISDLQVKFDTNTFEEWFCDPIFHKEKKETIAPKEEDTSVLDQSKVFLAQLAVKNLEKAKINFMNLEFYLTTNFEHLKIEDLKNMQKLFLQENEILKIQNYSSEKIDPLEKQMIKYSKNTFLKNIIFILIFDKKISEESLLLKNTLEKYKINFSNLLENKVLKLILKLALELCNAVNYKYTLNKKRVVTFRMSSLKSLQSYKGKSRGQNLLTFLVNQLKNKKEEIINEIDKLTAIQNLKEVNLEEIRSRINEFIIEHSDCTKKINFIEEDSEIKQYLKKVLSCAYHFLKELKEDYLKVEALAYKVRCKFCDCNDESVKSVLSDLSVFFKDFKEEFEKCTIL